MLMNSAPGGDSEDRAGHVQDTLRIQWATGRARRPEVRPDRSGRRRALEAGGPIGPMIRTPGASFALSEREHEGLRRSTSA